MPDTGSSAGGRGGAAQARGGGTWFTRKIGPLPAWGWGAVAVGVYYWYTHYGPGASKAAAAQQPAGGGGLKTYAPRITETIYQAAPRRAPGKPKPKRKPKPSRAGSSSSAPAAAVMAPAQLPNPGGPASRPPGVNPGGPRQGPPPRRKRRPPPPHPPPAPAPPPAAVPPGPEQVASANYAPAGFQTGGAVNADTGQPVYWEWQHAHRGPEVPMPVQAYAPMTNGSVYEAGSTAAAIAGG